MINKMRLEDLKSGSVFVLVEGSTGRNLELVGGGIGLCKREDQIIYMCKSIKKSKKKGVNHTIKMFNLTVGVDAVVDLHDDLGDDYAIKYVHTMTIEKNNLEQYGKFYDSLDGFRKQCTISQAHLKFVPTNSLLYIFDSIVGSVGYLAYFSRVASGKQSSQFFVRDVLSGDDKRVTNCVAIPMDYLYTIQ